MGEIESWWRFVWLRPGLDGCAVEWREGLGEGVWEALRQQVFTPQGLGHVCRRGVGGPPLRVVSHRGSYRLVCESTGEMEVRVLKKADVCVHAVNLSAMRDAIATTLGIVGEPGGVSEMPHACSMGAWIATAGVAVPTFLMFPPTLKKLTSEIQRLLLESANGFLLFVPISAKLERRLRDQMAQRRAMIVPLVEVVGWEGGRFVALPAWTTYCRSYCVQYLPESVVAAPSPYEFRRAGDCWSVRFGGASTMVKDVVGLTYIAQLLLQSRKRVFAPDLLAIATGQTAAMSFGSAGEQVDTRAMNDAIERCREIQEEVEEAIDNNDEAAQERLQDEQDRLLEYIKDAKGFGGRTRRASDDADRIRRSVTMAVTRAIDTLAKPDYLPAAARHFQESIRTGLFMSYDPLVEVPWVL